MKSDQALITVLILLLYPVMVLRRPKLRDQALILKFKSVHVENQDEAFKIKYIHT